MINIKKINYVIISVALVLSVYRHVIIYIYGNSAMHNRIFDGLLLGLSTLSLLIVLISIIKSDKIPQYLVPILPITIIVVLFDLVIFLSTRVMAYVNYDLIAGLFLSISIIYTVSREKKLKFLLWVFVIASFFSLLIPLVLFPEMIPSRATVYNGVIYNGGFWNSSVIIYTSAGWLTILLATFYKKIIIKIMLYSLFIFFVITGTFSLSRTFFLMIVSSVLFLLFYNFSLKKLLVMFLTIFLIMYFPTLNFDGYIGRIITLKDFSSDSRIDIYREYLSNIRYYFILGSFGEYRQYGLLGAGPHSIVINYLVQYGFFGLSALIYYFYWIISSTLKLTHNKIKKGIMISFLISYFILVLINQTGFNDASIYIAVSLLATNLKLTNG